MRPRVAVSLERERFELADGDFLDLDWARSDQRPNRQHAGDRSPAAEVAREPPRPAQPTVLILHGLEGSSESSYAWGMLNAVRARGWQGLVMHFRGCSGEANRLDRRYHSGETEDLSELVSALAARPDVDALAVVGFSLGGNVLLKWLGERSAGPRPVAAVAISVPFDLARCAARLETGLSRFYQWWLMRSMRRSVQRQFADRVDPPVDLGEVAKSRTFREFDDLVTAPLHGFADADDYYRRCSSRGFLQGIRTPTRLIQAADDPFMYPDVMPLPSELPDNVELLSTDRGGHVGFVAGSRPGNLYYWHEPQTCDFLAEHWPTPIGAVTTSGLPE